MNFQFQSFYDLLSMSGHGGFVWFSYAITSIALIVLVIIPRWQQRQLVKQLQRQQRIDAAQSQQTLSN